MFECMDHTCVPLTERCNGEILCVDGSDEYGCGKIRVQIPSRRVAWGNFMLRPFLFFFLLSGKM